MKIIFVFIIALLSLEKTIGQQWVQSGGGEQPFEVHQCLSDSLRATIKKENIDNIRKLGLKDSENRSIVLLDWPLAQAPGYNDNSYYLISNYVDQNPASNQITDYNCGNRTYDGHLGTDIAIWPYAWHKQTVGQVDIIAAQAGTIINKSDGNFDMNCSCTGNWNAVYVMHSDGSVAWYGHMIKGSLTTKTVGQTVAKGEYLGKVGSSGCSTGPHLHLELYGNSSQTNLVDPFAGPCNGLNGNTSWWTAQHPYISSKVLDIMVHDCTALSQPDGCPANTYTMCENYQVNPGSIAAFSGNFRQQQSNLVATYTIKKPDNSVWTTWNHNSSTNYAYGSWWWWSFTMPADGPFGIWKFEVSYNGDTVVKDFELIEKNKVPVGIGNDRPSTQLQVSKGDVYIDNIGSGVIIKSADGKCWRVTVSNSGVLTSTNIICPNKG